jgi:hypothetical protein
VNKYMALSVVGGSWRCVCDNCGSLSTESGFDPGEVSENVRKEGFVTYPSRHKAGPMSWYCRSCASKPDTFLGKSKGKDVNNLPKG